MKIKLFFLFFLISITTWAQNPSYSVNAQKMNQLLKFINDAYLDTVNFDLLVDKGMIEVLKELDPHSVFISKKDVQQANEPLQGSFDGIGVTFQLIKDTITVMEAIVNGPSEKVGIMAGDKIIKVDTAIAYGKHVNNKWVADHLRGPKGTKVTVYVKRGKNSELLEFSITRDKIPLNSINVYFMADKNTGYICLERFAQTSPQELRDALTRLNARGMKNLIFDLRGNGGGYLPSAFEIANEFIGDNKMIVYTDNFRKTGESYKSSGKGEFRKDRLVVLVDENSASASEIVSGAVQDWDRAIVMGRRTFGKGLVQKPIFLPDGSQVRLTISKYYTPSGRCVQRPYDDGLDTYLDDLNQRNKHGEFLTADSIKFPDSLKYQTAKGRTVYGGGGIMPDIFIPLDTSKYSSLYNEIVRKGRLVVLVDENSASASEIVSGALQDWDRAIVMGRRTFGKGLVQKPIFLPDGSQVRLTISKYYTPSGRCVQRPYDDGLDTYLDDLNQRQKHGEFLTADSIKFPDSLKYQTGKGRTVYGGGGIMPDIFIPLDTSRYSSLYGEMIRKGVISEFVLDFMEKNKENYKTKYANMEDFKTNFEISDELFNDLMNYAHKEGIKDTVPFLFSKRMELFLKDKNEQLDSLYNSLEDLKNNPQFMEMMVEFVTKSFNESMRGRNLSKADEFIKDALKYEIARNLFSYGDARQIFLMNDEGYLKALEVINNDKIFKKYNVDY